MHRYPIAILPGNGIGPEIIAESVRTAAGGFASFRVMRACQLRGEMSSVYTVNTGMHTEGAADESSGGHRRDPQT